MLGQPVLGELADRLEQAVPGAGGGVVGDDERLAHERVEVAEHVDVVGAVDAPRTRLARSKPPANTDVARSSVALVVGQQVVRPLDRVAQRELALGPGADPCSSRNRSASRSRTSTALIAAMRAAASSIPSGSPSTVSQISVTAVGGLRVREPEVGPHRTRAGRRTA